MRVELGGRQRRGRGDARLDDALGFGAQLVEQAGDFRQQRQAAVVGEQREEAARTRRRRSPSRQRAAPTASACGQRRIAEQRGDLRIGGDARGEAERVDQSASALRVLRQREGGAGVGTGEGQGLAHRALRSRRPARRAAPCGRWRRSRGASSFSAPATASADTCLRRSSLRGWRRRRSRLRPAPSGGWPSAIASFLAWSTIWLRARCRPAR